MSLDALKLTSIPINNLKDRKAVNLSHLIPINNLKEMKAVNLSTPHQIVQDCIRILAAGSQTQAALTRRT